MNTEIEDLNNEIEELKTEIKEWEKDYIKLQGEYDELEKGKKITEGEVEDKEKALSEIKYYAEQIIGEC